MSNVEFCNTLTPAYLSQLNLSELETIYAEIKSRVDKSIKENKGYMNMECEYVLLQALYGVGAFINRELQAN